MSTLCGVPINTPSLALRCVRLLRVLFLVLLGPSWTFTKVMTVTRQAGDTQHARGSQIPGLPIERLGVSRRLAYKFQTAEDYLQCQKGLL